MYEYLSRINNSNYMLTIEQLLHYDFPQHNRSLTENTFTNRKHCHIKKCNCLK